MVTVENDRESGRVGESPQIPVYLFFRFRTEVSGIFHKRVAAADFFRASEKFQAILDFGKGGIRPNENPATAFIANDFEKPLLFIQRSIGARTHGREKSVSYALPDIVSDPVFV